MQQKYHNIPLEAEIKDLKFWSICNDIVLKIPLSDIHRECDRKFEILVNLL